jgi:hypothetical protein
VTDITILCITRGESFAYPFLADMAELASDLDALFLIGADGPHAAVGVDGLGTVVEVKSHGYIESVLDTTIDACPDGYILRLDDDERVSADMYRWLLERQYTKSDHWAFPRMNLIHNTDTFIVSDPLWPDLQTRLSVKAKAGGRNQIHVGSPYGSGTIAAVTIEHHKYLVRSLKERRAIAQRYERIQQGAGTGHYALFSVPELLPDLETQSLVAA